MANLIGDIRVAVRLLRRSPGFTAVALSALALGIGANTAIFTVVNSLLLRPLPYADADRIVQVVRKFRNGRSDSLSIPKFVTWRRDNTAFTQVAAYDFMGPGMSLSGTDEPEQVKAIHASAGYFPLFGAPLAAGRAYSELEDRPGGPRVAVVSYGLWKRRFGMDRSIVGKTIILAGEPYTVIGVIGPGFQPPVAVPDVWLPLQADPASNNQGNYLVVSAMLKPGITRQAAEELMKPVADEFRRRFPNFMSKEESIGLIPLQETLVGDVRPALLVLLGSVGLVLLIACVNVANLMLARAAARQKEIAIRSALGAGRWRIARQLLTESLLLALGGAVLGLAVGLAGVRLLLAFAPPNLPRAAEVTSWSALDLPVLAFTLGVSLLTGLLFGLAPVLQVSRANLNDALKDTARTTAGLRHLRARGLLVISETALALVLLTGAALLIRTFLSLRNVDPGFHADRLLTFQMSLGASKYQRTEPAAAMEKRVLERLEALPGVRAAAVVINLPLELGPDLPFVVAGRPESAANSSGDEQWRFISPHYFTSLGIPLLRGRVFSDTDSGKSQPVVIINEAFAKRYWPKQDPVGQRMIIGRGMGKDYEEPPREVVGIVGNVRESGLNKEPSPVMYVPHTQVPDWLTALGNNVLPVSWAVRTAAEPMGLAMSVQREVLAVDRQQAVFHFRSMRQVMAEATATQTFNMTLLSAFAAIALLLAAIGIYGVISYSVAQRTREIGLRMALGAGVPTMLRMVLGQGMRLALAGVAAGLVAALLLSRLLNSFLFGVRAHDPSTYAIVAAVLAAVALAAILIPARRATRIDPIVALRYE